MYADQLARFPEAAAGHALGHYLSFGRPEHALDLAEANLAVRDNAESRLWLAQALLACERPDEALDAVETALSTPWVTAELHATAAAAYEAVRDEESAAEQRAAALAINPRIFEQP